MTRKRHKTRFPGIWYRLGGNALTVRDELERLREERDAAKRELREFEHVEGEPLYETAAVAASSFAFARHRAEAAEAEVRQLREERDALEAKLVLGRDWLGKDLARAEAAEAEAERLRAERDTTTPLHALREKNRELRASLEAAEAEVRRLTEGLREFAELGPDSDLYLIDVRDKARALLSASPSDGGVTPGPSFIPRDTDENPSDSMPSAGHSDWREEAEWWQRTCEYWRARALGEPTRADGGGA